MYSIRGSLVLAFHGCDESVRDKIVSNPSQSLLPSKNSYDWLGNGIYFWENDPKRALEYAKYLKTNPSRGKKKPIKKPSVIGAVINLGNCLDLVDSASLQLLKTGYEILKDTTENAEFDQLKNKPIGIEKELLLRNLDCAVIETVCKVQSFKHRPFDSVRGVFFEGKEPYPNAGFKEKNHMQICIRNPNCIKGYFIPRSENRNHIVP